MNFRKAAVEVLNSNAKWFEVTYKKGIEIVQKEIEYLLKKLSLNFGNMKLQQIQKAFKEFNHNSEFLSHLELASGHINDTYLVKTFEGINYVLQRINHGVFKDVPGLISNKVNISKHLQKKLAHLPKDELKRKVLSYEFSGCVPS